VFAKHALKSQTGTYCLKEKHGGPNTPLWMGLGLA